MSIVITILAAVLVFGLVIFIHELGHFLVAKKSGIKVNEFALGMGPTLFKFGKGETTYALRLLPIGGFVSMEGEDEHSDDDRSFEKAPIYKRILVIIAGAVMNLLLGYMVMVILVATDGDIASRTISRVESDASGLQVGDTITRINGRRCFVIDDMVYEFARTQNGNFSLTVVRDGETVELENVAFEVKKAVDADTGEYIIDENTGEPYEYMDVGFKVLPVKRNVFTVARQAFYGTLSYARLIYQSLFDLIAGRAEINQLSGPVGIVSEIGKAAAIGWQPLLRLLAIITINLGVVNMLPLPALDGGRTLLLIVEAIRKKPLPKKYEMAINFAGFALLMGLMLFVSINDIQRLVT